VQPFLLLGIVLMVLKYGLDTIIAAQFHHAWFAYYYIYPANLVERAAPGDHAMYLWLWLFALPFFWAGVALTLARLRDAGLRTAWLFLFFIPVANLLLFFYLCLAPSREEASSADEDPQVPLSHEMKRLRHRAPVLGVLLASALGLLLVAFSANYLLTYGWGLFLGVPFIMGFVAGWFLNAAALHSRKQTITVSCLSVAAVAMLLIGFHLEGLVCLAMAAPLALPLAIAGGLVARSCIAHRYGVRGPGTITACLLVLPLGMLGEHSAAIVAPVRPVVTSIVIHAPVHAVWQSVIAFPPLPPPVETMFRAGVAYPIGATISGEGVGAIRRCRFSTGDFVEPITVWDTDHLLAFNVASQPPALHELGLGKIHTPHVDLNYMRSNHGQFRLVALDANHTLLEGTTWYADSFWPQVYWRAWSDGIVHRIHLRVLQQVKRVAEQNSSQG
jgi:uncharacterized membrane protein YhaH (DUF805 family)